MGEVKNTCTRTNLVQKDNNNLYKTECLATSFIFYGLKTHFCLDWIWASVYTVMSYPAVVGKCCLTRLGGKPF